MNNKYGFTQMNTFKQFSFVKLIILLSNQNKSSLEITFVSCFQAGDKLDYYY